MNLKTLVLLALFSPLGLFAQDQIPLKWSGDLRYRLAQSREAQEDWRRYHQMRARLGVDAQVNEEVRARLRLATGISPTSANYNLGASSEPGMVKRDFGLDLAFILWRLNEGSEVLLGRVENPHWSPGHVQTLFDADLVFEGAALRWRKNWSKSTLFSSLGAFMIAERYNSPDDLTDIGLAGGEIGYEAGDGQFRWTLRGGFHVFSGIKDQLLTSVSSTATVDSKSLPHERFRGNSVYPDDPALPVNQREYRFRYPYEILNLGVEVAYQSDRGKQLIFFAETIRNLAANQQKFGLEAGVKAKMEKSRMGLAYILKEADSTLGVFTDGEAGGGGTDHSGWRAQWVYSLGRGMQLTLSQLLADRARSSSSRDFALTLLDLTASF